MKNLRRSTWRVKSAANIPSVPRSYPISSSLIWRGVYSSEFYSSLALIFPSQLFFPTTIATNHPSPVAIYVPERRTGVVTSWDPPGFPSNSANFSFLRAWQKLKVSFLSSSDSPVIADSFARTPEAIIATPSTGTSIPAWIFKTSPTTMLPGWITFSSPFLLQVI